MVELGLQVKPTEGDVEEAPDPDKVIVVGELEALLVTVTVPERLPVVVGAKITLKVVDCPADKETGRVRPLTEKFVDAVTCEMETTELPELVRVTLCDALEVPVVVEGKLKEVGEAERVRIGETAEPDIGTIADGVGELLASVRLAE